MWNYALNNSEHAEATEEEVTALIANGKISPDTLVWKAGMDGWAKAKNTELGKVIQLHQKQMPPPLAVTVIPPKLPKQYDESLAIFTDHKPAYTTAKERWKATACELPILFLGSIGLFLAIVIINALILRTGIIPYEIAKGYLELFHGEKDYPALYSFCLLVCAAFIQTSLDRSGFIKRRFNMRIVDYSGSTPSYVRSFFRGLLKLTVLPIIWIQFTPKKPQGLHDLICKTLVIKTS